MSVPGTPVALQGNPNPPGVSVGAGADTMPAYQPLPGGPDIGPMPAITKHTGEQANWWIVHHNVNRPWSNGFHKMIREGQLIWIARTKKQDDDMQTQVNLYQLNHMISEGYSRAINALRTGVLPEGVLHSIEDVRDAVGYIADSNRNFQGQGRGINEQEIDEYLGRDQAFEDEVPEGLHKNRLRIALDLAKMSDFRYLWAPAILFRWNFWGVVNNISEGTSPEERVRATQAHRRYAPTSVVNCVIAKKGHTSNVWGDGKTTIAEGAKCYIVLRRRYDGNGNHGAFEFVPYASLNDDGVPDTETVYTDVSGKTRYGPVITVGTITEITARPPAPNKRRQAIGNGREVSIQQAHDATGSLPKIVVQLRV